MQDSTSFLLNIVFTLLMTFSATGLIAQVSKEDQQAEFLLAVQNTSSNKISMECTEGCAWKTLSFRLSDDSEPQAIDEYGMTGLEKADQEENADLSNFLFTIERKGNKLFFKGIEGTAWTELSFSVSPQEEQAIDERGMAE